MLIADQINEDIKQQVLEFGKWATLNGWKWGSYVEAWWNSRGNASSGIKTDDELYQLFLKRNG